MLHPGCLPLIGVLVFLVLLPFFFANLLVVALSKLGLSPQSALLALAGMVLGGTINIPVKRIPRKEAWIFDSVTVFGFGRMFPRLGRSRPYTTVAVNVGGCLVPCLLALYQCVRVIRHGPDAVIVLLLATLVSIGVCYWIARPVPGVGIAMPALIPPVLAAIPSVLFMPDFAPPIAFVAGVLGPLVGADLLHLSEIKHVATGVASIGGAGTFDGIVLSGLMAALLA